MSHKLSDSLAYLVAASIAALMAAALLFAEAYVFNGWALPNAGGQLCVLITNFLGVFVALLLLGAVFSLPFWSVARTVVVSYRVMSSSLIYGLAGALSGLSGAVTFMLIGLALFNEAGPLSSWLGYCSTLSAAGFVGGLVYADLRNQSFAR